MYTAIIKLVIVALPALIKLVSGFFKKHSPEFYFDNGTDKTNQYFKGTGGNPHWLDDQVDHARKGIIGLYQNGNLETYAGGAGLYYLPMYAFDIHFQGKNGVETWKGDENLQKLAVALYLKGELPTQNMPWNNRPPYKITDGIQQILQHKEYLNIVNQHGMPGENIPANAPSLLSASTVQDLSSQSNTAAAAVTAVANDTKSFISKYPWVLAIPVLPLIMLFRPRR